MANDDNSVLNKILQQILGIKQAESQLFESFLMHVCSSIDVTHLSLLKTLKNDRFFVYSRPDFLSRQPRAKYFTRIDIVYRHRSKTLSHQPRLSLALFGKCIQR